jgi:hypothetical protein
VNIFLLNAATSILFENGILFSDDLYNHGLPIYITAFFHLERNYIPSILGYPYSYFAITQNQAQLHHKKCI